MAKKKDEKNPDAKAEERKRLKSLAFSRGLLSRTPSRPPSPPLEPSKTVLKHQGRDVVKKGQRKNRFLFSFPGFIAPIAGGGKIGELSDLGTGNPVLYLDFPQGRVKLFGTIVYSKNRYLTLQFARKNVLCEDSFNSMVVFSDAWWIGRKDENPEELQLKFPKELNEGKSEDYDFKGGAGAETGERPAVSKPPVKDYTEPLSPDIEFKDNSSEDSDPSIGDTAAKIMQVTPVRQSTRTAGKMLNYAEPSSGDDSISSDTDRSDEMDEKINEVDVATKKTASGTTDNSNPQSSNKSSERKLADRKSESTAEANQSSLLSKTYEEKPPIKRGTLVQATLSTLFEKVAEKKLKGTEASSSEPKGSGSNKRQRVCSTHTTETAKKPARKEMQATEGKAGARVQRKQRQVEDDVVEEISSDSQDADDSDGEWAE